MTLASNIPWDINLISIWEDWDTETVQEIHRTLNSFKAIRLWWFADKKLLRTGDWKELSTSIKCTVCLLYTGNTCYEWFPSQSGTIPNVYGNIEVPNGTFLNVNSSVHKIFVKNEL